jgi:hypothetical protein
MDLPDDMSLRALAESVAGGLPTSIAPDLAHAALSHGFQRVLLYGGVGVWLLGAASFLVFGAAKPARDEAGCAQVLT